MATYYVGSGGNDGNAATKADPVVIVAGRAHRAADVRVRVDAGGTNGA